MSKIVLRVLFILVGMFLSTSIWLGVLWEKSNPPVEEEYKRILDEYIPIPSKTSQEKLREAAYTVEVTKEELEQIRPRLHKDIPYHYTTAENLRLIHFYSVIMNRYEPSPLYRDTSLLAEYVFDGLLKREQLQLENDHRLTTRIYVELFKTIATLDKAVQDEAIERIARDFDNYAEAEVKESVYKWHSEAISYGVEIEYLDVQQKFFEAID